MTASFLIRGKTKEDKRGQNNPFYSFYKLEIATCFHQPINDNSVAKGYVVKILNIREKIT